MTQVQPARDNFFAARDLHDTSQYSYLTLLLASVIVLAAVSTANVDRRETTLLLFLALVALIAIVGWALMRSSSQLRQGQRETANALDCTRKVTLALTQDLHMDSVLDALLRWLSELVPYTGARVLVPEGASHWLALRERFLRGPNGVPPLTLIVNRCPFFERVVSERKSMFISDTELERQWTTFNGHQEFRSWLSVPLIAGRQLLGILSVGHAEPNRFNKEDLRRAELLAIPAAAAIQKARLFSRAEICASELEKRLADLHTVQHALDQSETGRRLSEESFEKIFRTSPVALSITTLEEGRFLEVNPAFENCYGYKREELMGRTVSELGIWHEPAGRIALVQQLRRGGPIRNVITRVRTKSGVIKPINYSADRIQFEGEQCILAVSDSTR